MTDAVRQIDDGGLAFPCTRNQQVGTIADHGFSDDDTPTYADVQYPGMTLRDWFAGQALAGMLAGVPGPHLIPTAGKLGKEAYGAADALIAARKAGA